MSYLSTEPYSTDVVLGPHSNLAGKATLLGLGIVRAGRSLSTHKRSRLHMSKWRHQKLESELPRLPMVGIQTWDSVDSVPCF